MAALKEAVVVPDIEGIREQAEKLGYIVKQKGRIEMSAGSSVCHEIISPWDPWYVTSNSGEFGSRQRPFRSRLFNTEEEALALLPEILRDDARSRALGKYEVWITQWEDGRHSQGRPWKLSLDGTRFCGGSCAHSGAGIF